MSRARENADGARLDAPLASPAFTGTPTGIVTGSMVDGTITAAKVAADVATQAELDAQRTNSSITTLGTVTAGNLSNTAIVYPAGHIIRTTDVNMATTYTNIAGGSNGEFETTVVTQTITPLFDNSSIIVNANFNVYLTNETTGTDTGYAFRWLKTGTGVSTANPLGLNTNRGNNTQGHSALYFEPWIGSASIGFSYQHVLMDQDVETTNAVTYTLEVSPHSIDGGCYVGSNTWYNYQWTVFLQEIKR